MILPVYLYGHPVLREEAKEISADYPALKELVANMFDTMYHAEGVGLAAPQIGLSLRLIVLDGETLSGDFKECKNFKRVLVNPVIEEYSDEEIWLEEGCLSLPGIHEKVPRAAWIRITYADENGLRHDERIQGFAARIVQHECEHLNGGVFIDNISPIRRQLNKGKLNNIIKGTILCDYKTKAAGKK
ncbi:MAG: peptide deformylase [Tannerellaceae bacterium]|jgi:peptide deformylase|nr:peptide deformylase [Tannerellaceae bacterium]